MIRVEEVVVINAWDLRTAERCGERVRRRLNGSRGQFVRSAKFQTSARLVGDVALAHTEMRAATPSDFPQPLDLLAEQQALYRAAASGYLALFQEEPAKTIDLDRFREFPEHNVQFRANPGIAAEVEDGKVQIRALRLQARVPSITEASMFALALLWSDRLAGVEVEYVVADLLAMELERQTVDLSAVFEMAESWFANRLEALRAIGESGQTVTGMECSDCPFVWDCPAYRSARR